MPKYLNNHLTYGKNPKIQIIYRLLINLDRFFTKDE